jgi:CBS domain-containing protein
VGKPRDLKGEFLSVVDRAYIEYKKHRKVEEIMSKEVFTTTIDATIDQVARIMGEKHIGSLIVKKYDTAVGIITERDLLSSILALGRYPIFNIKVEEVMSYPLITICPDAEIKEAARMMIKKKGKLAVFRCGDLVGVVTASDLIRSLPDVSVTRLKIDDYMSKHVITADEKTPIATIAKIMGEKRIGSVIITSKDAPHMKIFTERDLLTTFLAKGKSLTTEVGKASASPIITVNSGTSIHKAATTMTSNHIRRLPVTKEGELVGIITARDLVEAYAK